MRLADRGRSRAVAVTVAGVVAAAAAGAAELVDLLPGLEQETIVKRYERRDTRPTSSLSPSTTRRSRTSTGSGRSRAATTRGRSTACAATAPG
jgi:hypothetical protein